MYKGVAVHFADFISFFLENWAAACDFQQCGILTSVDSDGPL